MYRIKTHLMIDENECRSFYSNWNVVEQRLKMDYCKYMDPQMFDLAPVNSFFGHSVCRRSGVSGSNRSPESFWAGPSHWLIGFKLHVMNLWRMSHWCRPQWWNFSAIFSLYQQRANKRQHKSSVAQLKRICYSNSRVVFMFICQSIL